jgi:hypothetical protein
MAQNRADNYTLMIVAADGVAPSLRDGTQSRVMAAIKYNHRCRSPSGVRRGFHRALQNLDPLDNNIIAWGGGTTNLSRLVYVAKLRHS